MVEFPLQRQAGHLFVEMERELWLLDTGSPTSFGHRKSLSIAGKQFPMLPNQLGLDAATLSRFVSVECAGLLGADVLASFDLIFDLPNSKLVAAVEEIEWNGQAVDLHLFMGIPIVTVKIRGDDHRMFWDTGAQVSYWDDDALSEFPSAGTVSDFYPGLGRFQTDTHNVELEIGSRHFTVRCGALPTLLEATLAVAGTTGIVGNEILAEKPMAYLPRRNSLIL